MTAGDPDELRRAELVVAFSLSLAAWGPGFAILYWALGLPTVAATTALGTLGVMAPLAALRWTGWVTLAGNLGAADLAWVLVLPAAIAMGGVHAPQLIWLPIVPMLALLLAGWRSGVAWAGIMILCVVGLLAAENLGVLPPSDLDGPTLAALRALAITSAVLVVLTLASIYELVKHQIIATLEDTNEKLLVARDEAEAGNRAKSAFLATMSHELRTPLTVILGYADMLDDVASDPTERTELVTRIRKAGSDLLELIESTLAISKFEAGSDEVRMESLGLKRFWATLGDSCTRLPRRPGVVLEWTAAPDESIVTDGRKLSVVLRNLVNNALKFTDLGSVRAEVEPLPEHVCFRVTDTGIGIPPEEHATVFEMFRQADASDSRRHSGVGLGLYIVRRFVEQLGGTIALSSTLGTGSTFSVTLPREHGGRSEQAAA